MSTSYKFFLDELDEVENIRKSINYFLSKHGETQKNDFLGIRKIFGEESILTCFELAPLIPTWKKRRKIYRIEIKTH